MVLFRGMEAGGPEAQGERLLIVTRGCSQPLVRKHSNWGGVGRGKTGLVWRSAGLFCVWIMGSGADVSVAGMPGVMWNEAAQGRKPECVSSYGTCYSGNYSDRDHHTERRMAPAAVVSIGITVWNAGNEPSLKKLWPQRQGIWLPLSLPHTRSAFLGILLPPFLNSVFLAFNLQPSP